MYFNQLKVGRVVGVFYDDGVQLLGMVSEIYEKQASISVVDTNNDNYIGASVCIRGVSSDNIVEGKDGWYLPS